MDRLIKVSENKIRASAVTWCLQAFSNTTRAESRRIQEGIAQGGYRTEAWHARHRDRYSVRSAATI